VGWSLGYLPPKEPELLDAMFLAVGKALYLANAFEAKCRFVLRIAKLAQYRAESGDASAVMSLAQTLKDGMLGRTINDLNAFPEITLADIALLEQAKDARNFIAHEGAGFGYLSSISAQEVYEQVDRLRREVDKLVAGDNIVSRWVYEIEEKEPAPLEIQKTYALRVRQWVFGPFELT
jgi:hypothetical protein